MLARVIGATIGFRLPAGDEVAGLDLTQQAEAAHAYGEFETIGRTG